MNNIQDGEFDLSELRYAPAQTVECFRLQKNDVLFNRTNSWEHVGKAAIWRRDEAGPAFASYLVRLHCSDELLSGVPAPLAQLGAGPACHPSVRDARASSRSTSTRRTCAAHLIAVPDTWTNRGPSWIGSMPSPRPIEHHRAERAKTGRPPQWPARRPSDRAQARRRRSGGCGMSMQDRLDELNVVELPLIAPAGRDGLDPCRGRRRGRRAPAARTIICSAAPTSSRRCCGTGSSRSAAPAEPQR